jgi:hypothetical protein
MDDMDAQEVRRRAWEAITSVEETKARLAERAERRQWAGSESRVQPEPAPAPPRAPTWPEGRDWQAEAVWINSLIDMKIAGLVEGIGKVVALERQRTAAATEAAIDVLREELRTELKQGITGALAVIRTALDAAGQVEGKGLERIAKGIGQIEQLLQRLDCSSAALRLDARSLPN